MTGRSDLPEGTAKVAMVREMFDVIAPRYDLVNRVMTLGLDRGWRRRAVALLELVPSSLVLDLACGTGDLARELSDQHFRAVGADLSFGMLVAAPRPGAPLVEADATALPLEDGAFDGVLSGFAVRNFADLAAVLAECARVLRPGGRLGLLDVDTPSQPLLRAGHRLWFTAVVPRIGALLSDRAAYSYLPRSVAYLPPRQELLALVADAGFTSVEHHSLSGGITQVVTATRLGARPLAGRTTTGGQTAAASSSQGPA
jgi:demethylmenaquinone methyltransferase/2-methoxy-6-polyprenyl-1,4-benzoquinol methylase